MPDVLMPRLSDSVEDGTILRWLADDGAEVRRGEAIAELEIGTAIVTCEADADGVLRRVAGEGDTLPPGAVLATIGNGAEPAASHDADGAARTVAEASRQAPADAVLVETGTAKGDVHVRELSRTQQTVARRTAEAKAIVPELSLETVVDMERCVALRARLEGSADPAPSFGDMVVKATAQALREVPRANAAYRDGRIELYSRVNVGVAVAAEDELMVPTVFDADRKDLAEIAAETRTLAQRVRDGVITPPELSGATFTVSDLGAFGVTRFEAVIAPPQAGILAVGAVQPSPAARDGRLVIHHLMTLTLTADHRILYGAEAARFLDRIKALLEEPASLMG